MIPSKVLSEMKKPLRLPLVFSLATIPQMQSMQMAAADDDPGGIGRADEIVGVAQAEVFEPDIVGARASTTVPWSLSGGTCASRTAFAVARAAPDDRLARLAVLFDCERARRKRRRAGA